MAIVVEDGTGLPNAVSYVSVDDCKAYLNARGKTAWGLLTTAQQEASLINATDYLDAKYGPNLLGTQLSSEQALCWPREYVPLNGIYLEAAPLPQGLIRAACEAALVASTTDLMPALERGGQVIDKLDIVGPITERTKWNPGAPVGTQYPAIDRWMKLFTGSSGTLVGSVVRG
jgi:hypothetical protein